MPDQISDILLAGWILLKQLPYQRFGVSEAIRGEQRLHVGLAGFERCILNLSQRLQNKDSGSHLALCDQALAITQCDAAVRRIFGVGPLKPLRGVGAGSFRHLCEH